MESRILIGNGAYSKVYRDGDIAVKTITGSFSDNPVNFAIAMREWMLMHMCSNMSHVVKLISHTRVDTYSELRMQYYDTDLYTLLLKYNLLFEQVVTIIAAITCGLANIHARGIVHCDIKPGNILLRPSTGEIVICDFNISYIEGRLCGTYMQTMQYRAPEIDDAVKAIHTSAIDVWSLGCIAYEIFTGTPFCSRLRNNVQNVCDWYNIPYRGDISAILDTAANTIPGTFTSRLWAKFAADTRAIPHNSRANLIAFIARCTEIIPGRRPTTRELLTDPLFGGGIGGDIPRDCKFDDVTEIYDDDFGIHPLVHALAEWPYIINIGYHIYKIWLRKHDRTLSQPIRAALYAASCLYRDVGFRELIEDYAKDQFESDVLAIIEAFLAY